MLKAYVSYYMDVLSVFELHIDLDWNPQHIDVH